MATFQDNLKIINTAVYGKEMRPAISEALIQSWDAVNIMMGAVDQLNARIDALPSGGGGSGGDGGGGSAEFFSSAYDAAIVMGGGITPLIFASEATAI